MPYLRNWRNLASRSCILQRETVLVITPQPQCVFAQESSACLLLRQPNATHGAKEGLGYLWLRGHCCLAGGLCTLKPLQMCSLLVRRLIWHEKALFALAPAAHPEPARQGPTKVLSWNQQKSRIHELYSAKRNCAQGANLSTNGSFHRNAALAHFSPCPMLPTGPRRVWAPSGSLGSAAWLVLSLA